MDMNNKRILVVGGAGYIGSHIVQSLCDKDYKVIVFDNFSTGFHENIDERVDDVIEGDIRNGGDLEKLLSNEIDVIFHFAANKAAGESMEKPEKYSDNNLIGTLNLLNKTIEKNVKYFVFSSSAAVYGNPEYLPIDEEHPQNPTNYYGYTKLAIEQNLKWFSKLKGLRYSLLRYFNATGYDINGKIKTKEADTANLSPIVMETAYGIRETMKVFGNDYDTPDGTCIRDYVHVSDLAEAHVLAMNYIIDKNENLVVNLGSENGSSVIEVIEAAKEQTGKEINYTIVGRREGDPANQVASSALANKLLGWRPKYSDLDTIFKTMIPVYFK